MKALDVAVAGCGPAGLCAALLLARDGHRVVMFERFENPRPIGSGLMLQPTGLAVLDVVGLAEAALKAGARIERLIGIAGNRIVLDVRYGALRQPAFAVGVHRAALFDLLYSAVGEAGVEIRSAKQVTGRADGRLMIAGGSTDGPFDLIIDALGSRSALAPQCGRDLDYGALWTNVALPKAGFDGAALSQRYRRANVMAGVMPMGRSAAGSEEAAFFWSLRADQLSDWRTRGLDAWKARILALWPECESLVSQVVSAESVTFARYAHRTLRSAVERRMIHIGDAWHSASPQLGQGANMAMLDAYALARSLREAQDVQDALVRAQRMRRAHVHLYQMLTAILTPVYQSDSRAIPFVRDRLVGPLSRIWPIRKLQAALVAGLVGSPLRRLGIDFAQSHDAR